MSEFVLAESSAHSPGPGTEKASSGCVLRVLTQWPQDVVWPPGEGALKDHPKGRTPTMWVVAQRSGPASMGPGVTRQGLELGLSP